MNKRILITGGAGFIGAHLLQRIVDVGGCEVLVVDNFSRGRHDAELDRVLGSPGVKCLSGDLTDPALFSSLGQSFDQVYHFAAIIGVKNVLEHPERVVRVNALSTLHLLDWICSLPKRPKFLFASTSEAYAWTKMAYDLPVPTPEEVPLALTDMGNPRSSYAGSKIFGELATHQYHNAHKLPFAIVRYHNVYGARMGYEHVIPELHERIRAGQRPLAVYSAHHRRAFCHVSDAVDATHRLMNHEGGGISHTFNIGNPAEEYSIADLAKQIGVVCGENDLQIEERKAANDPITRRSPDISRLRSELGWEPSVSLAEGLRLTLSWYASNPRPTSA